MAEPEVTTNNSVVGADDADADRLQEAVTGESENVKPEVEEKGNISKKLSISSLEEKIIRQIEFYFGDRNLPRDKHLQQAISADPDGWVPITFLLNFNRLKALSTDVQCISNALHKSSGEIVEVKGDGQFIRRHPSKPLALLRSKEEAQDIKAKTVSVKGFPLDSQFDDIQEFFDQFGKTKFICMKRTGEKAFKGSVFAEFESKADADKFLALPSVTYKQTELFRESKEAYMARKNEKQKRLKESKKQASTDCKTEPAVIKDSNTTLIKVPGAILHFNGCGENSTREDIKEVVSEFAEVAWIDFSKGCTEGYVRFKETGDAKKVVEGLQAAGGKLNGTDSILRVLEGDEETTYWKEVMQHKGSGKRGGWRGGRGREREQRRSQGGKGQKRLWKCDDENTSVPSKQFKQET